MAGTQKRELLLKYFGKQFGNCQQNDYITVNERNMKDGRKHTVKSWKHKPGVVVHTRNPSMQKIMASEPAWATEQDPAPKKKAGKSH